MPRRRSTPAQFFEDSRGVGNWWMAKGAVQIIDPRTPVQPRSTRFLGWNPYYVRRVKRVCEETSHHAETT